jgi:hypothetical protein
MALAVLMEGSREVDLARPWNKEIAANAEDWPDYGSRCLGCTDAMFCCVNVLSVCYRPPDLVRRIKISQ